MKPLRVIVTADPELPVPPRVYGGIERVVALLVDGLSERGHDVTLVAHPESNVSARLVPYPHRNGEGWSFLSNAATIARTVAARRPDVVHSFGRLASLVSILPTRVPKVMSYQRAITPTRVRWASRLAGESLTFVGCSRKLIEGVETRARWRVVHNGTDVERAPYSEQVTADAPLVFLGRIEAIKGAHTAIAVAKATGRTLVIAGNVPDEHREYFEREVAPFVDGRAVQYIGPVDDAAKGELLARAAALLMPVEWEEPFGIVMAEALAAGTPVVGFNRGAVPEVVDEGVTGFVCAGVDEMTRAVRALGEIARSACRRAATERFSQNALVNNYERVYGDAVTGAAR